MRTVPGNPGVYRVEVTVNLNELRVERVKDRYEALISYATHFEGSKTPNGIEEDLKITLTQPRYAEAVQHGYTMSRHIAVGDLTGKLRIAIQDRRTGTVGSVRVPIAPQEANSKQP